VHRWLYSEVHSRLHQQAIQVCSLITTRFRYNGLGARVAVEVEGRGTTTYTLDYAAGNRILAETTGADSTLYLYGHDCLGELRDDEWLYYLSDAEGLVRQGVDGQGEVVSAWLFDPDGAVLEGPEGPVSHLVCGGVYDWSTGLIYKDGRYFDPLLGIWLALVPLVVAQSWQGRKKRRGWLWVWLLLLGVCVGGTLMACGPGGRNGTPTPDLIACVEPPTNMPGPPTFTPHPPIGYGQGYTPTPTPTSIWPTPFGAVQTPELQPTSSIPTPNCTPAAGESCINPYIDSERDMVAHVLLQEGGTTIGIPGMQNIAQVIRNRINDTSGHFPATTAIGIVSQGNGDCHGRKVCPF